MLDWSDEILAALQSGGGAIRALITVDISDVTYRFIDEPDQSLTLDGVVYSGLGSGISFSGVPAQGGMQAGRFAFTIPSAALLLDGDAQDPLPVLSSIYDETYQNREIDVEYAIFTSAPGEFVARIPAISGRIASAPLQINPENGTAMLSLECQTLGQDFGRTNAGSRGSALIRRFYPEDTFGDFVVQAVTDRTARWGLEGGGLTQSGPIESGSGLGVMREIF
jgi:hypothetical protein